MQGVANPEKGEVPAMNGPRTVFIACLAILLSFPASSGAQWAQTNGPGGGTVRALAVKGTRLLAGTPSGVFISTDNAENWKASNAGLPRVTGVGALGVSGPNVLASMFDKRLYYSSDGGESWSAATSGLPENARVRCFGEAGPGLFAGTDDG